MRAYTAHLAAKSGLLLGGLPMVRSAPFESSADAQAWLAQCIEANREAGRRPTEGWIVPSDRWPECQIIPKQDPAEVGWSHHERTDCRVPADSGAASGHCLMSTGEQGPPILLPWRFR